MTQVSKYIVDKDVEQRMQEVFLDAVADVKTKREVEDFILDFLTPTEQIMLPKRLSIALLLVKGYEQRLIASYLKVSFTTITRVSNQMKTGGKGYRRVIGNILNDEKLTAFLDNMDDGIAALLGPLGPVGSNWKSWKANRMKKKLQERKPF